MLLLVFAALYLVCSALLLAVVWQDRGRGGAPPTSNEPQATHGHTRVFGTHV